MNGIGVDGRDVCCRHRYESAASLVDGGLGGITLTAGRTKRGLLGSTLNRDPRIEDPTEVKRAEQQEQHDREDQCQLDEGLATAAVWKEATERSTATAWRSRARGRALARR